MIRLQRPTLPADEQAGLAVYQAGLASALRNDPAIRNAWRKFTADRPIRSQIELHLRKTSDSKCAYCENTCANTIDHYYPKLKYPAHAFAWENFIWACWPCNAAKRNEFPIQRSGTPVYLNPLTDDPAGFFVINRVSGLVRARPGLSPADRSRAVETIKQLKLNRDDLPQRRLDAAKDLEYALAAYERYPLPEIEAILLGVLSLNKPFRAVVRQIMTDPSDPIRRLVEFCLQRSDRVRECVQTLTS